MGSDSIRSLRRKLSTGVARRTTLFDPLFDVAQPEPALLEIRPLDAQL
jgi:hypothetical protein